MSKDVTDADIPQTAFPNYSLGNSYLWSENYRKAWKEYSKGIEKAPNCVPLYMNRAKTCLMLGKIFDECAERDASKIIELSPTDANGYLLLGEIYLRKDKTQALQVFRDGFDQCLNHFIQ